MANCPTLQGDSYFAATPHISVSLLTFVIAGNPDLFYRSDDPGSADLFTDKSLTGKAGIIGKNFRRIPDCRVSIF